MASAHEHRFHNYTDQPNAPQKFLLLGSASPDLLRNTSETLAGRIAFVEIGGFQLNEVEFANTQKLWLQGGFPRSFLAEDELSSFEWRENFLQTFLERDIPSLGIKIPSQTLRRFWMMLSHYHGQVLNYSELARSFGIDDKTVRRYIDILEGTFMVSTLQPWYENLGKRLVKQPKLYLTDSGIFHVLQNIRSFDELYASPKLGASWEGFALREFMARKKLSRKSVFFWATHAGAEIDLFWKEGGQNFGAEFKFSDAPKMTKSLTNAIADLDLQKVWIIYPGIESFPLSKQFFVQSISDHFIT